MWFICASKFRLLPSSLRVLRCYHRDPGTRDVSAWMPEAAGFGGVCDRSGLQEFSVRRAESFWAAAARHRLSWISPFHTVQDCDLSLGKIRWFEGGKLNVSGELISRRLHCGVMWVCVCAVLCGEQIHSELRESESEISSAAGRNILVCFPAAQLSSLKYQSLILTA